MAKWCHLSYSACTLSDLGMCHCHIQKAHRPTPPAPLSSAWGPVHKVTPALAAIIIIIDPDTLPWALPDCMEEILAFLSTLSEHSSPVESLPPKREEGVGRYFVHNKVSGIVFPAVTGTVFGGNLRIGNRWHTQLRCWPHYLTAAMHFKLRMSYPNYNCLKWLSFTYICIPANI